MHNLLDPAILFFLFGIFAGLIRSNLSIPEPLTKFLSLYLLMGLGLKGGFALSKSGFNHEIVITLLLAIFLAVLIPVIGYNLLKKIIEAILDSIRRVFFVSLLLFIILYIYATMGSILFGHVQPERWGDLGISMITLFQVLTLSSWETVHLPIQQVYWWAWIYFFSFVVICCITVPFVSFHSL
jgi:hypothetical protein